MSVTGIIPGRPYNNTQSDKDDYAMCVSGRLSVTTLHCLVDLRGTPEKYQFFPEASRSWKTVSAAARSLL